MPMNNPVQFINKMLCLLKMCSSTNANEAKIAARKLRESMERYGDTFPTLKLFFEDKLDWYDVLVAQAQALWDEMDSEARAAEQAQDQFAVKTTIVVEPEPGPDPATDPHPDPEPAPKTYSRHDPNSCPGEGWVWVNEYIYERAGKVVVATGYWRRKPAPHYVRAHVRFVRGRRIQVAGHWRYKPKSA